MSSQSRSDGACRVVSRRTFVASTLAAGTAAVLPSWPRGSLAQEKAHRIDVHHHLSPPTHIEALRKAKLGTPPTYNWSVQKSLEDMDKAGVATSITSVTTPAASFLDTDDARRVARECNEYAARLMTDHPEEAIFSFELVLASLRRPELAADIRASYYEFIDAVRRSLEKVGFDDNLELARVVFATVDGLSMQHLIYRDRRATEEGVKVLHGLLRLALKAAQDGEKLT